MHQKQLKQKYAWKFTTEESKGSCRASRRIFYVWLNTFLLTFNVVKSNPEALELFLLCKFMCKWYHYGKNNLKLRFWRNVFFYTHHCNHEPVFPDYVVFVLKISSRTFSSFLETDIFGNFGTIGHLVLQFGKDYQIKEYRFSKLWLTESW